MFVTAFSPLCMIITAVLGATVLSEPIHLGSLIGAIIIVIGLYSVVWGKSKDRLNSKMLTSTEKGDAHELPTGSGILDDKTDLLASKLKTTVKVPPAQEP
ncbi:hypothetical protein F0562_028138 [Nyssa sinensis]|uniref:WAT1-related protein n=1 Tax=Nyssa sinensis TaxID=561372 RepID=A0A5J5BBA1_9ASTE|nr:hypothetical protein F0562_028138 [Nyssa sinensis]